MGFSTEFPMHVGMNRPLLRSETVIGGVPHARGDEPVPERS